MRRLTVGDNGHMNRGPVVVVQRKSLGEIEPGEEVEIRFRDDFETTGYRRYRLQERHFGDSWDESVGRWTGTFVLADEEVAHA